MFGVGFYEVIKGDGAVSGIIYIGRDGGGSIGGSNGAGNKDRSSGVVFLNVFNGLPGELSGFDVEFANVCFELIVCLGDGGGIEGVGFNDVGTGF